MRMPALPSGGSNLSRYLLFVINNFKGHKLMEDFMVEKEKKCPQAKISVSESQENINKFLTWYGQIEVADVANQLTRK